MIFRAIVARKTPNLALPSLQHSVFVILIITDSFMHLNQGQRQLETEAKAQYGEEALKRLDHLDLAGVRPVKREDNIKEPDLIEQLL